MKKIIQINKKLSIWGDKDNYSIRRFLRKGKNRQTGEMENQYRAEGYFGSIDLAFQDLFENMSRDKLLEGKEKTMKEIKNIILETRKEILEIMKPFKKL